MPHSLSIIMPALNEEKNISHAIENSLKGLEEFRIDGEIIVVNDGSTDNTQEIINSYMNRYPRQVRTLFHHTPQGLGASFWDAAGIATKDAVVILPGDAENDAYEIMQYIGLLENVDMVIPYVFNKEVRSKTRNFLSSIFLKVINTTFGLYLNYTNGTVIYRRSILSTIIHRERGFLFQVEILVKAINQGYLFAEVPYKLITRDDGRSKAVTLKALKNVIFGYIRLFWKIKLRAPGHAVMAYPLDSASAKRRNTV